ncbi:MAG: metallophosphoesterase family protein [Patescibacteria group bacterium]|nr:metallophosphoesterase family protein [Patescibacteria group bacterium]
MKYLLIADIHGNNTALKAVFENATSFDEVLVLGDFVGYGPRPNKCVETIQQHKIRAVKGNHDAAVLGNIDLSWFNTATRDALEITQKLLSRKTWLFLKKLPLTRVIDNQLTLVHGSPRKPLTEYIRGEYSVKANVGYLSTFITLVGHTHVPTVYENSDNNIKKLRTADIKLDSDSQYIVNPGSVGQPRDGDPRASYALLDLDSDKLIFKRVTYDIQSVQKEMRSLGFPNPLQRRLSHGI